jgi:pyridoxamine 5'-phosphate oxidase
VLLKGVDDEGFSWFTNYDSRKGRELTANPHASLVFPWFPIGRQVVVFGPVARVSAEESDEYFATRDRGSQIGAWASPQSEVIPDRDWLESRAAELERRFAGGPVPRPRHWGGFRLRPEAIDFWANRENRLHDRFRYRRTATGWTITRLAP